jgi:hypothetical protein
MKLYSISGWHKKYENNRTKELVSMTWVPVPNKHDGEGYTLTLAHENGPALFGCWMAIVQVASKCDPRGTLLRDTQKPHNSESISRLTRFPVDLVQCALDFFSSEDMRWLEVVDIESNGQIPHEPAGLVSQECAGIPHETARKGMERKEGKVGQFFFEIMPKTLLANPEFVAAWELWVKDRADRGRPVNSNSAQIQFQEMVSWPMADAIESLRRAVSGGFSQPFRPSRDKTEPKKGKVAV